MRGGFALVHCAAYRAGKSRRDHAPRPHYTIYERKADKNITILDSVQSDDGTSSKQ